MDSTIVIGVNARTVQRCRGNANLAQIVDLLSWMIECDRGTQRESEWVRVTVDELVEFTGQKRAQIVTRTGRLVLLGILERRTTSPADRAWSYRVVPA